MIEQLIMFGFAAFVCTGIYKLIRARIDRNNGINDETFERLARAFIQHKKETRERLQNLEAIVSDESSDTGQVTDSRQTIEIPEEENRDEESRQRSDEGSGSNLRNMLRE